MRGEWIEIFATGNLLADAGRLSLCGESGLKWMRAPLDMGSMLSLPMRGEWIEITPIWYGPFWRVVSPHAGRVD